LKNNRYFESDHELNLKTIVDQKVKVKNNKPTVTNLDLDFYIKSYLNQFLEEDKDEMDEVLAESHLVISYD